MAMTATISMSPATVYINQPSVATLTISNSGASAVNILNIQPTAIPTGSSQAGSHIPFSAASTIPGGNAQSISVPASGSIVLKIPFNFFEPSVSTYSIGAIIQPQTGAYFSPTAATVTVQQLPFNDAAPGYPINP